MALSQPFRASTVAQSSQRQSRCEKPLSVRDLARSRAATPPRCLQTLQLYAPEDPSEPALLRLAALTYLSSPMRASAFRNVACSSSYASSDVSSHVRSMASPQAEQCAALRLAAAAACFAAFAASASIILTAFAFAASPAFAAFVAAAASALILAFDTCSPFVPLHFICVPPLSPRAPAKLSSKIRCAPFQSLLAAPFARAPRGAKQLLQVLQLHLGLLQLVLQLSSLPITFCHLLLSFSQLRGLDEFFAILSCRPTGHRNVVLQLRQNAVHVGDRHDRDTCDAPIPARDA
eukprot:3260939-Pleurochrysis_carterae.AAC.6